MACATEKLRPIYLKYHNRIEKTGRNDDSLIYEINKWGKLPLTAPYCGTSIGFFVAKSGLGILGINKGEMPLAFNWKKKEKIVWDVRNGWRSKNHQTPNCDELFVVLFRRADGGYHVGVALYFHGKINFITGQGNTSNWRARRSATLNTNATEASLNFREQHLYLSPLKYQTGSQKGVRQQGVFLKETYAQGNVIAIMAYQTYYLK